MTSNPSPQYIARVSSVFQNDGNGVTGNLQAVITAILTDPEARAGDDPTAASPNSTFGHMREPVLFLANLLRGLNATLTANSAVYHDSSELGENLFDAPSVFSYFSPQYRIAGGLLGPEFQIYTTQTAADRADIVNSILYGADRQGHNGEPDALRAASRQHHFLAELHQLSLPARLDVACAGTGGDGCGECGVHSNGQSAGRALRRPDVGRVPNYSLGDRQMLSRRGFIRAGAATVGTLALRPFGLLPAMAQSGANYRALVCVFLFGGNDSNNTVIPMDDASYPSLHVDSRQPGAIGERADAHRVQRLQRALCVSRQAG